MGFFCYFVILDYSSIQLIRLKMGWFLLCFVLFVLIVLGFFCLSLVLPFVCCIRSCIYRSILAASDSCTFYYLGYRDDSEEAVVEPTLLLY